MAVQNSYLLIGGGLGAAAVVAVGAVLFTQNGGNRLPDISLTEPAPAVTTEQAPQEVELREPEVTLVRVDQLGAAVIGGTAEPGIALRAIFGGEDILATRAEASGDFVMLADLPPNAEAQELVVVSYNEDGSERARSEPVLILGREAGEPPVMVIADEDGTELVEATPTVIDAPPIPATLSLDTITYDEEGFVELGGRGNLSRAVRIYLDNEVVSTRPITEEGAWSVSLPDVDAGLYTLRVDEISAEGQVTSRVESPFKKEIPELQPGQITVQPGNTLWALAADQLGEGERYVVIFKANKDLIRDPNLIYPGQIFTLPEE